MLDRTDVESEWDEYAAGWDDDPVARAYADAAFDSLTALLRSSGDALDGARVLDFGCGTGLLTERLVAAGAIVDAVDTSGAMIAVLADKIGRRAWTAVRTHTELASAPDEVDLIVCSSVCAFVDDYPATASELVTRLRPGGRFVQWDWERASDDDHGLTRDQIRSALRDAGLTDVDVTTAFDFEMDGHRVAPLMGTGRLPQVPV